jgi:hypothetical protein
MGRQFSDTPSAFEKLSGRKITPLALQDEKADGWAASAIC